MAYVQKPGTREGILIFGNGDEASFITCGDSSNEGFMYFKFTPTPQMKWRRQIPPEHYHRDDKTLNKLYKKDLCIQLSYDPDFPMWLILCDYYGNENTPLFEHFVRYTQLLKRNRQLEYDKSILESTINRIKRDLRRKAQFPKEDEQEKLNYVGYVVEKLKPKMLQPEQSYPGEDDI